MHFDAARLSDHILIDPDGSEHVLGDRWKERPQVILFLRHFG